MDNSQRIEGLRKASIIGLIGFGVFICALPVDIIPSACEIGHVEQRHSDAYDVPTLNVDGEGHTTVSCCTHYDARDWEEFVCDETIPGVSLYAWLFKNRNER